MKKISLFALSFFLGALAFTSTAYAASASDINLCSLTNTNVSMTLLHGTTKANAGSDVTFSGTIQNSNSYPILDVSIVARITKLPKKVGSQYEMATDSIARIVPVSGIYLPADSNTPVSFTWHVPADLLTGPYRVDIFLDGSGQFAVGGNEYLGVPVATYPLAISGTDTQTSYFDPFLFSVAGAKVSEGALFTLSNSTTITPSIYVRSTYAQTHNATVTWYLYDSNFVDDNSLVATTSQIISLSPGKMVKVAATFSGITQPHYLVVAELGDGTKTSFISARVGRSDVIEPFARSLYMSTFPLSAGKTAMIQGCFTENFSDTTATTTLNISLVGADGTTLYSGAAAGAIAKGLWPFSLSFVPQGNVNQPVTLTVNATDHSGKILSSASVVYACGVDRCMSTSYTLWIIIGLIVTVLVGIWVAAKKKKSMAMPNQNI